MGRPSFPKDTVCMQMSHFCGGEGWSLNVYIMLFDKGEMRKTTKSHGMTFDFYIVYRGTCNRKRIKINTEILRSTVILKSYRLGELEYYNFII